MKRIFAFLLCVSILMSCAACGSGSQGGDNVVTFAKQTSGTVQQTVLGPLGETWENNRWIQRFKDELGIDVKYDWLVDTSQYFEKLNLMMSRNQLPDIYLVDTSRFHELYASGCLQPLTGLFDEYASDELKEYFSDSGQAIWDAVTVDGDLYAIPNLYSPLDRLQYLWIRTDWLEKLNLSEPQNFRDVLEISTAFTTGDPDGNGQNDTYGFGVCGKPDIWREYYSMSGLFSAFGGMAPRVMLGEDGKLTKSEISDENRNALEQIRKLVEKGEIDPNFSTLSTEQITEAIGQNKIGMFFGEHWVPNSILASIYEKESAANPDYGWKAFPVYDLDGNYARQSIPLACNGWYVINKDYAHPEVLIQMLNVYLETIREDPAYYADNEEITSIWSISPVSILNYLSNVEIYDNVNAVLDGEKSYDSLTAADQNTVNILKKWRESRDPQSWGMSTVYEKDGAISVLKQYLEHGVVLEQDYYFETPDSVGDFGAVLDQIRDQFYIDVLIGNQDISTFSDFKNRWESSGGTLMLDDLNRIYSEAKQ